MSILVENSKAIEIAIQASETAFEKTSFRLSGVLIRSMFQGSQLSFEMSFEQKEQKRKQFFIPFEEYQTISQAYLETLGKALKEESFMVFGISSNSSVGLNFLFTFRVAKLQEPFHNSGKQLPRKDRRSQYIAGSESVFSDQDQFRNTGTL